MLFLRASKIYKLESDYAKIHLNLSVETKIRSEYQSMLRVYNRNSAFNSILVEGDGVRNKQQSRNLIGNQQIIQNYVA